MNVRMHGFRHFSIKMGMGEAKRMLHCVGVAEVDTPDFIMAAILMHMDKYEQRSGLKPEQQAGEKPNGKG